MRHKGSWAQKVRAAVIVGMAIGASVVPGFAGSALADTQLGSDVPVRRAAHADRH